MKKLIPSKDLQQAIVSLSQLINNKCEKHGGGIVFVCVLKGGFMFFSDLVKHVKYPIKIDFVKCKSYNNRKRMNTEAIKQMIAYHDDYHFKPVWDGTDKNLKEIEAYRVELDIPKHKTYVMPAGDTRETLIEMYPKVFEMVAIHGYNMTGRDHIIAYNTERGV